jgi:hypothetical protein
MADPDKSHPIVSFPSVADTYLSIADGNLRIWGFNGRTSPSTRMSRILTPSRRSGLDINQISAFVRVCGDGILLLSEDHDWAAMDASEQPSGHRQAPPSPGRFIALRWRPFD